MNWLLKGADAAFKKEVPITRTTIATECCIFGTGAQENLRNVRSVFLLFLRIFFGFFVWILFSFCVFLCVFWFVSGIGGSRCEIELRIASVLQKKLGDSPRLFILGIMYLGELRTRCVYIALFSFTLMMCPYFGYLFYFPCSVFVCCFGGGGGGDGWVGGWGGLL